MGVDKEATDIWKFGRVRPDLTLDETLAAKEPELSENERIARGGMIRDSLHERLGLLTKAMKMGFKAGRHHTLVRRS